MCARVHVFQKMFLTGPAEGKELHFLGMVLQTHGPSEDHLDKGVAGRVGGDGRVWVMMGGCG